MNKVLLVIGAWLFSYFVLVKLGEPQSTWLWCQMMNLC